MYEITVSVRNLIEFILRSGDIDNRVGGLASDPDTMQEGSRIHRTIQRQAGADYNPEVSLSFCYEEGDCRITVEGRADGIIRNKKGVTVDEIKSTYADVMSYTEPRSIHLSQAKFYAHMMALKESLPAVSVRLTYVNIATEEVKYFNETYFADDLKAFCDDVCSRYVKWAVFDAKRREKRDESIKGLPFPFDYREGQDELVRQVYYTIYHKRKLFLEAPTGVGKTVATLYPSIQAMGQGLISKIFYLTAKTITRTVAGDCISLLSRSGLKAKSIILTAKEKICLSTGECNPDACPFARGHFDRVNDAVFTMLKECDEYSRETIIEYAERFNVCPFETSLDLSMFCDVIICDYNYAFDPRARLKRYFAAETKEDYLFLIDEAHNLVDRAREMYSAILIREDFSALKAITAEELPGMSKKFSRCYKAFTALKSLCDSEGMHDFLLHITNPPTDGVVKALLSLYADIDNFIRNERKSNKKKVYSKEVVDAVLDSFFEISHFLNIYELVDENYSVYAAYDEFGDFFLKLMCVNPCNNLAECMGNVRSSVLFSATLLPIKYHKNLLGGVPEDYEVYAKSIFDPDKRGLFIAKDVTSKYTRRGDDEYRKIARYIHLVSGAKPGNYMVFAPSYKFIENVYKIYEEEYLPLSGAECLLQDPSLDEAGRESFLSRFTGNTGAPESSDIFGAIDMDVEIEESTTLIGFCVLGGIFSEGIDLKKDSLIGVIIIGTGIPQVCLERELMKDIFDKTDDRGYDFSYKYPGMNKVLQAAGRVIRTEEDTGVVVLLDERFLQRGYREMFPREWENFRTVNLDTVGEEVAMFWDRVDS